STLKPALSIPSIIKSGDKALKSNDAISVY
ncbi:MAG: hypothetical protein ACI952_001738, partial [Flavobacteriales bacterium]